MKLNHDTPRLEESRSGWLRPLALLLALCVLAAFYSMAAGAAGTGTLEIYLFHDRNGDGAYQPGVDVAVPTGQISLGFSADTEARTLTTIPPGGASGFNGVTSPMKAGTWTLNSVTTAALPTAYRLTGSFGLVPAGEGDSALRQVAYAPAPSIVVAEDKTTKLYIPVVLQNSAATLAGHVLWADNHGGPGGAIVELVDIGGNALADRRWAAVDSDGRYTLSALAPGSYRLRTTVAAGSGLDYAPLEQLSEVFTVLDGESHTGPTVVVHRSAQVRFWLDDQVVVGHTGIGYNAFLAHPTLDASLLQADGGTKEIIGWYRDSGFTQPWHFETDTVTAHLDLYAKWELKSSSSGSSGGSGSGSSSSGSSGGTNKADSNRPPEITGASGRVSGESIILSVETAGGLIPFYYQWQVRDNGGNWVDLPNAESARCTLSGFQQDTVYQFRAAVTRSSDLLTAYSDVVRVETPVYHPEEEAIPVPAPEPATPPTAPSTGGETGTGSAMVPPADTPTLSLSLSLSSSEPIYVGGRVSATPSVAGEGDWDWDEEMVDLVIEDNMAVFTALQAGTTEISYTAEDQTARVTLDIRSSALPATGQSVTPIVLFAGMGAVCLLGALVLAAQRRRKEQNHG